METIERKRLSKMCFCVLVMEKGVVGVRDADTDCRYGGGEGVKEQKVVDEWVRKQVKEMEEDGRNR